MRKNIIQRPGHGNWDTHLPCPRHQITTPYVRDSKQICQVKLLLVYVRDCDPTSCHSYIMRSPQSQAHLILIEPGRYKTRLDSFSADSLKYSRKKTLLLFKADWICSDHHRLTTRHVSTFLNSHCCCTLSPVNTLSFFFFFNKRKRKFKIMGRE